MSCFSKKKNVKLRWTVLVHKFSWFPFIDNFSSSSSQFDLQKPSTAYIISRNKLFLFTAIPLFFVCLVGVNVKCFINFNFRMFITFKKFANQYFINPWWIGNVEFRHYQIYKCAAKWSFIKVCYERLASLVVTSFTQQPQPSWPGLFIKFIAKYLHSVCIYTKVCCQD